MVAGHKQSIAVRTAAAPPRIDIVYEVGLEAELLDARVVFMDNDYGIMLSGGTHSEYFKLV